MTTNDSILGCFRRMLASGGHSIIPALYSDGALFDINLPQWRYQLRGPASIRHQFDQWHPQPPDLVEWHERKTPWGAIVELALWEGDNYELYSRSIHCLDIDHARITRHVMYCTGDWTKEALHEATAGLIEPHPTPREPASQNVKVHRFVTW